MPDDLRGNWCKNTRNKVHNTCSALKTSPNHPPTLVHRKTVFQETVPDAKSVGDHCSHYFPLKYLHIHSKHWKLGPEPSLRGVHSYYKTRGAKMRIIISGWYWNILLDVKKHQRRGSGSPLEMVCTQNIGQSSMSISWEIKWHYKRPLWKGEWQGETCRKASEDFSLHTLICSEPKPKPGKERREVIVCRVHTRPGEADTCWVISYVQLHLFPPTWLWWAFPSRSAGFTWEQPTVTASLSQPLHVSIPALLFLMLSSETPTGTHSALRATQKCGVATFDQ